MGLDMYLNRKHYYGGEFRKEKWSKGHTLKLGGEFARKRKLNINSVDSISQSVAYWRKANQIHNWFVSECADGVDNCQPIRVHIDQLQELADTIEKVLKKEEKPEDVLPNAEGFFFGNTEYDKYYYEDLTGTLEILKEIFAYEKELNEQEISSTYIYQASW
jgi:hypothetical protein